MLDIIKSQLTDDGGTQADEGSPDRGIASTSRTDDAHSRQDDAAREEHASEAEPSEPLIELDEIFGLLKNRRRRDVLRLLTDTTEERRLGELAEEIAARECGKDVSQINSQERKRVYVGLYQCHLPKLADVGVVAYNKPRGTVERGPTFDQVTRYLPEEETTADQDAGDRPFMDSLSNILSTGRFFR